MQYKFIILKIFKKIKELYEMLKGMKDGDIKSIDDVINVIDVSDFEVLDHVKGMLSGIVIKFFSGKFLIG